MKSAIVAANSIATLVFALTASANFVKIITIYTTDLSRHTRGRSCHKPHCATIPQSIQVIPQQVLKIQQVTRIGDALRNVSGVTQEIDFGGFSDKYTIRGFEALTILKDGFRVTAINENAPEKQMLQLTQFVTHKPLPYLEEPILLSYNRLPDLLALDSILQLSLLPPFSTHIPENLDLA